MSTTNELIAEGIQELTTSAAFFRDQGEAIEQSRQEMIDQADATGQSILNQLLPLTQAVYIYVDSVATNGNGTSGTPFNNVEDAIMAAPTGRATYIYLKAGTNFMLGNGSTVVQISLMGKKITFKRWGSGNRPKIMIPHYDLNESHSIAAVMLYGYFDAGIGFESVDIELTKSPSELPVSSGTCFIYPYWGCSLELRVSDSDLLVPDDMALAGLNTTCQNVSLQFSQGVYDGGGDLVLNSYGTPVSLTSIGSVIALDTYLLSRVRTDRMDIVTSYEGSQLARGEV